MNLPLIKKKRIRESAYECINEYIKDDDIQNELEFLTSTCLNTNNLLILKTDGFFSSAPPSKEEKIVNQKLNSTLASLSKKKEELSGEEFGEWLAGFTDAEGKFSVGYDPKKGTYNLQFRIGLHSDDKDVLNLINKRLGCGKVYDRSDTPFSTFIVSDLDSLLNIIIPFFNKYFLRGNKYLDFLVFKQIVEMINKKDHLTIEGKEKINGLLKDFNKKRTTFTMPKDHKINITPYYLLGLIEGEGSFTFANGRIRFSLTMTETQKPLIEAVKSFIDSLAPYPLNLPDNIDYSRSLIYYNKASGVGNAKPSIRIEIGDFYFINKFFTPLLENLQFLTKKREDFNDWNLIKNLMVRGLHLDPEGQNYISALLRREVE